MNTVFNDNGVLEQNTSSMIISANNRGFLYGDAVFETLKVVGRSILFFEDHYFRLMASMRVLRMEIPMHFTPEFLSNEILKTIEQFPTSQACFRVRLTVYRNQGGRYLPTDNLVGFCIHAEGLEANHFILDSTPYEVEIFRDFLLPSSYLFTLKTNNRVLQVVGSRFAEENDFDNCILLNERKEVAEFLNGNLFMVTENSIKTPPLTSGCLNGILRKQLLSKSAQNAGLNVVEQTISAFELQQAQELWVTNSIQGIRPVTKFRKHHYGFSIAEKATDWLNQYVS